jgi:archaellum component FlaC|nr:MAG TPA: hypothetical protein [Caudoviricetes sp.]
MNEIKIYLKMSGRIAELYKDFDLYEGCYRNSQMSVYVPKSLLYENEGGTFANLVKTGAILTAPNGTKLTTKSYYLDYVKTETVVGIAYAVYTIITPKEFCVYAGTQTVVVNVESIDNTDKDNQKVISVTTTQTANLIVLESAYLGQDEPIEPTELDKIKATLKEIEGQIPGMEEDITGLQSKVSDISDKVSTLSDVTTELMSDVDNLSIQVSDLSEDKLDKQSGATAYEEAYVKDTDGSQKMERVTITSIASAIVKRDANGNINIAKGLSGNPKNGANMENIADVEEKISKCPTLDGNNDFTGENTFEEAIQAKKGTVVKNSLDETNYNAGYISRNDWTYLFPADSGTFALTKNIPTDYATQTALANTQRQVDGLYTLLEQKNEIYVQTATDTYTTRETAGGENIADGVQTPVKKITGKTVKTTNLMPYPYTDGMSKTVNGVTFTVNTDGAITINGTATGFASFIFSTGADKINFIGGMTYYFSCRHGIISYLTEEGGEINYIFSDSSPSFTWGEGWIFQSIYIQLNEGQTENNLTVYPMLNEGSTALPYMPYFPGLKNAFFKEIVSTGRNLIQYPYAKGTDTLNGVTFTVNNDGTIIANGTATENAIFIFHNFDFSLSAGTYTISGLENGGADTYCLQISRDNYTESWNLYNGNIQLNLENTSSMLLQFVVYKGASVNNVVLKPMLNYGSSALPYEPYTQSVLSLPEAVELTEYDTAYPETGEIQRQSNTLTFNGTETWYTSIINDCYAYYVITKPVGFSRNGLISNKITTRVYNAISGQNEGCYMSNADFNAIVFWFLQTAYPNLSTSTAWKAQLAAWNEAGNPLTVTYKTAEITTEQADFSADSYIAWKNGSETIEQGDTDNSEYGAENTVEQDYYLLTAPEEVTKE